MQRKGLRFIPVLIFLPSPWIHAWNIANAYRPQDVDTFLYAKYADSHKREVHACKPKLFVHPDKFTFYLYQDINTHNVKARSIKNKHTVVTYPNIYTYAYIYVYILHIKYTCTYSCIRMLDTDFFESPNMQTHIHMHTRVHVCTCDVPGHPLAR